MNSWSERANNEKHYFLLYLSSRLRFVFSSKPFRAAKLQECCLCKFYEWRGSVPFCLSILANSSKFSTKVASLSSRSHRCICSPLLDYYTAEWLSSLSYRYCVFLWPPLYYHVTARATSLSSLEDSNYFESPSLLTLNLIPSRGHQRDRLLRGED